MCCELCTGLEAKIYSMVVVCSECLHNTSSGQCGSVPKLGWLSPPYGSLEVWILRLCFFRFHVHEYQEAAGGVAPYTYTEPEMSELDWEESVVCENQLPLSNMDDRGLPLSSLYPMISIMGASIVQSLRMIRRS